LDGLLVKTNRESTRKSVDEFSSQHSSTARTNSTRDDYGDCVKVNQEFSLLTFLKLFLMHNNTSNMVLLAHEKSKTN
jgi:hypothetical protein